MKLIRWPSVCILLACLLAVFFIVGQSGNTVVRPALEQIVSNEFSAPTHVGALDLSVYGSHITATDLSLSDPGDTSRCIFSADQVDLQADLARFFERRALISQAHADHASLRLHQTQTGGIGFLSDTARTMIRYEPASVRLQRILKWTTDQVNPLTVFPPLPASLSRARQASMTNDLPVLKRGESREVRVRGFRLRLPQDYPEVLLNELIVSDSTIELVPFGRTNGIVLTQFNGACTDLSTNPRKHPDPISFTTRGFVAGNSNAWCAIAGTIDLFAGRTNIFINFAMTNLPVAAALPFARAYVKSLDALSFKSGLLSARGQVHLVDGVVQPSIIFLRASEFTAHAESFGAELAPELGWMKYLSLSNSMFELAVPLDSKKPYFHVAEALKQQNFKFEMKNIEINLDLGKDAKNLLNGVIDMNPKDKKKK